MNNPEAQEQYRNFVDHVQGKVPDELDLSLVTMATPQEIGWWKQFQVRRAIRHARAGNATHVELCFLRKKGLYYPNTRKLPET